MALPDQGREQFTTDSGTFTLGGLPLGPVKLTVRRLGYSPSEVTLHVSAEVARVTIELTRIAVQLGAVTVRAHPPCTSPGPPTDSTNATLMTLFTQLRINSANFRVLAEQYPFVSVVNVLRAERETQKEGGQVRELSRYRLNNDSRDEWRYKPGSVVVSQGRHQVFNIPSIRQVGDDRFLAEHCFHYAGVDTIGDLPLIRLDVVAAERLRKPDVTGSLYLDPNTFQIRRSVLALTKMPPVHGMIAFETTTDFDQVMESIPVITRVFSEQTYDTTKTPRMSKVYEQWQLVGVKWVKQKPGEDRPSTP